MRRGNKKVILGITGGFGTGKSTVAAIFGRLGAIVISADKIAHDLIKPKGAIYKKVVSLFGVSILKKDKNIDRDRLGKIVFKDKKRLLLLNSIIHPEVIKRIKKIIKKDRASKRVYVIDAPLLIEAGCLNMIDRLIVVTLDPNTQIKRSLKKWSLNKPDIINRIRSQMPLREKAHLADFVIDNRGSLRSIEKKVKIIWREIKDGTRKRKG